VFVDCGKAQFWVYCAGVLLVERGVVVDQLHVVVLFE